MTAILRNGDYCPDGMGGFRQAWGGEEVLERVLFQLTARRGSFPLLPQVGSRLYLLGREKPAARTASQAACTSSTSRAMWSMAPAFPTAWPFS